MTTSAAAARHMDGIYRYQRYIYDATRKYFLLGRDRLLVGLAPPPGGAVLEVACGTSRNLIEAARLYPGAALYGFDISKEMLATARRSIASVGLEGRIAIAEGDATAFDAALLFGRDRFERVFISYALSMIPPWREALEQAFAAVAPGGELHIVDFGEQEGLPRWFRTGLRAWLGRFSVEPRAGLAEALGELALRSGGELRFRKLYRGYCDYAVLTRPRA